jgi:hypothetical protein
VLFNQRCQVVKSFLILTVRTVYSRKNKAEKARPKFHGRVLRLREFLPQNRAILRNAP